MAQIKGDLTPSIKTVRKYLLEKYGDEILLINSGRSTVVCYKNTGYKVISDAWYQKRSDNPAEERLRVIREAATIIREDIRSVLFDVSSYPPSDTFLQNAESKIPESLKVFLSEVITKNRRFNTNNALRALQTKCTAIAHTIVSAVRPRSFYSSVKIGVGAFLYKKFGSKTLIDVLSSLGFSASYCEVLAYGNSCIHAGGSAILKGAFSTSRQSTDTGRFTQWEVYIA
ncbi:hypothetical protein ALC57_06394 [Trachymyrmex cornetzi]|uniref:Uncharacterized protein n=1 Tax=Trachymyrmex cornetzi TaxID=471704 RepID=A0A151J8P2_9HYME|nr:hypothetical protein ALC57_06394 [Trachymyrmex cornetzi]